MLQSVKAKLVDLLSAWLEEARNQEGEEIGAYANCAHDLNAIVQSVEEKTPLSQLYELIEREKITMHYTINDDGIHVYVDGELQDVRWFF